MNDSHATITPSAASATTPAGTSRHFWRLREDGAAAGLAGGALPALGLLALSAYALAPFARNDIQAHVAREVRSQLVAQDMAWAQVSASGQQVLLTGKAPSPAAGDAALAAARATTCDTWAGPLVCPEIVVGAFADLAVPAVSAPAAVATAAAPSSAGPAAAAVTASQAAQACDRRFAELLSGTHIEFATGRADIGAASAGLLDRLAEAARGCPGRVQIEGHTDNVGSAESNRALSQARAEAVRAALVRRGLAASQFAAVGRGADRPLGDNATAAGRASNRRIEFKASAGN